MDALEADRRAPLNAKVEVKTMCVTPIVYIPTHDDCCVNNEGLAMQSKRWIYVCFAAWMAMMWMGCGDDPSGVLPPVDNRGSGGAPIQCEGGASDIDALLDDGAWPMVLGHVVSVEPVLERFTRAGSDEVSSTACKRLQDADPALQITVQVDDSSWDAAQNETLTVVLDSTAFYGFSATPQLRKNGALEWSDRGSYFPTDSRLLIVGGLLENGELYARGQNIYEVQSDDTITGYQEAQCVNGTLNDRSVHDVLAQAQDGWDGEPPRMRHDAPVVATRCH